MPNHSLQVYGMLLARELPQVAIPDELLAFDIDAARMNIEKAAYHGFAKAQVKMGAAYELCQLGCEFDPQMSLHYNILAARQGEPEAEMAISKWFLCGHEGLFEKNDEIAFKYAKRAASSGLPTAEFALGYFYEIGIYVPVDIKEARTWYAKAAASGNKDATGRIDSISRSKTLSKKDHETVAIAKIKSRYGTQRGRGSQGSNKQAPATAPYPENDFGPGFNNRSAPGGEPAFGFDPNPPQPAPLMTNRQPSQGPGQPPVSIGYSAPVDRRPMPGPGGPPPMTSVNSAPNLHGGPGPASPSPRPMTQSSGAPHSAMSSPGPEANEHVRYKPNLPGKGPKTFEEMGVPKSAKESDCVSDKRYFSPSNRSLLTY